MDPFPFSTSSLPPPPPPLPVLFDPVVVPSGGRDRRGGGEDTTAGDGGGVMRSITLDDGGGSGSGSGSDAGPEPFESERLPPTLARDIQRFLRVANAIETEEPYIAYLCRQHALETAHKIDRNSTDGEVQQFRTSLLRRLEQDQETALSSRKEGDDIRAFRRFYDAYMDCFHKCDAWVDLDASGREKKINAHRIAWVLYEVLKILTHLAMNQDLAERADINSKSKLYVPYNVLPESLCSGGGSFDSERLPPTLASEIQRFLRIANLIETVEPRIAYLCRHHAFEVAHNMDHSQTDRRIQRFKTSLLHHLEQDEETTLRRREERSDIRELRRAYHAFKDYVLESGAEFDLDDIHRGKLINASKIACVLFEILKTVTNAAETQDPAESDDIDSKSESCVPYNILPRDQEGIKQVIMQLPEV